MEGWEEVPEQDEIEKVVLFPQGEGSDRVETRSGWSLWAAAASVALLGGVVAMVLTADPTSREMVNRGGSGAGGSTVTMSNPEEIGRAHV